MKNTLHKIILFLSVFLFSWGYGQTPSGCNNQKTWTTNNFTNSGAIEAVSSTIVTVPQFTNLSNVTNANTDDASTWLSVVLNPNAYIEIRNNQQSFQPGTYAGIVLSETSIAAVSTTYRVETYNGNTATGDYIEVSVPISAVSTSNRNLGVLATKPFNRIRLTVNTLDITTTSVNYAYTIEPCTTSPTPSCNTNTPISQSNYAAVINYSNNLTGTSGLTVGNITNLNNIVNNVADDFATISLGASVGASAQVSVRDLQRTYEAGDFVGFEISNSNILDVRLFNGTTIVTYLDGQERDRLSGSNLLVNLSLLGGNNKATVGFVTTKTFNEVQYIQTNLLGLEIFGSTQIYNLIVKRFCGIESNNWDNIFTCNDDIRITNPVHSVYIDTQNTKTGNLTGLGTIDFGTVATISNVDNIINSNTEDYASLSSVGLGTYASIAIKNAKNTYSASINTPYFVGFEISTGNLLNLNIANNVKIKTYLNGNPVESSNISNTTLVGATVIDTWKKGIIGFVATQPFDEIRYEISSLVGAEVGATRIHNLIIKRYCENLNLTCEDDNVKNKLIKVQVNNFPLQAYSSVNGVAQIDLISGSQVQNISNLIDDDDATFVRISPTVNIPSLITIGVEKLISNFPANTYAEFEIKKNSLVNLSLLSNYSIKLYQIGNPTAVKTLSSETLIVGLGLFQIAGDDTQKIGFKSDVPFNRAELIIDKIAEVDLGVLDIYRFNVMKICDVDLTCEDEIILDNSTRPVIINGLRTGSSDLLCVECDVSHPDRLIDNNPNTAATIRVLGGVAATNSISVKDLGNIYPIGTKVAFSIQEINPIFNLDLLNTITVTTYLDNAPQEVLSGASLFNINVLFLQIFPQTSNVGFKVSKPFDEVQISIGSLGSLLNYLDVFALRINTSESTGGTLNCVKYCTKLSQNSTFGLPSSTAISTLSSPTSNILNAIPNGHIALEAKNKGFVITRTESSDNIEFPVEGMLIYDIGDSCTKLYTNGSWKCLERGCND